MARIPHDSWLTRRDLTPGEALRLRAPVAHAEWPPDADATLEVNGRWPAEISRVPHAPSWAERSLSSISHAWSSVWKAECRMRNGSVDERMRRSTSPMLYARMPAT